MAKRWNRISKLKALSLASVVLLAAAMIAPIWALGFGRYTAMAAMVQAFSVTLALVVAIVALSNERAVRRTDRVLELHRELTSGPTNDARVRLARHLRRTATNGAGLITQTSRTQLRDPALEVSMYGDVSGRTPDDDVSVLVRFFERAGAALDAETVDERLFTRLIGGHAGWFSMAVADDRLWAVASAADAYAAKRKLASDDAFRNWGKTRTTDFGSTSVAIPNDGSRRAMSSAVPPSDPQEVQPSSAATVDPRPIAVTRIRRLWKLIVG